MPSTVVYYLGYETLRDELNRRQVPYAPLISGCTARIFTSTLVAPIELHRTLLQAGSLSNIRHISNQSISAVFRGLKLTLYRYFYSDTAMYHSLEFTGVHLKTFRAQKRTVPAKCLGTDASPD